MCYCNCSDGGGVMTITVRNVPEDVAVKLSSLARKKNISREQYVRDLLEQTVLSENLIRTEDRYETLVRDMADVVSSFRECLEENNVILQRVYEKL